MTFIQPREHYVITIDGGGMKGLMVAQALVALEQALTGGAPLISDPRLKILVGTSTGSVIGACIAAGMCAPDIVKFYTEASKRTFPPLAPIFGHVIPPLENFVKLMKGIFGTSLYPNTEFVAQIREVAQQQLGNPDITMGQLHQLLKDKQQVLITTTGEIAERRTHFIKSDDRSDADWKLWEAVLTSSSAPTVFPVYTRPQNPNAYFTDGGVGAQGNPVYISALEAIKWRGYHPSTVTIFSFGTGWMNTENFIKATGKPTDWNIIKWGFNGSNVIIQDTARSQSIDIVEQYCNFIHPEQGLDFRRYQPPLVHDFDPFASGDQNNQDMVAIGTALGNRLLNNQHAFSNFPAQLHSDPVTDPEGLVDMYVEYVHSLMSTRTHYNGAALANYF
ncbi:MAG: patatin-like phospholipase family protein [Anaerolineae bacterium]|nr:patatin-like phospholipase family protein [Anaerolineae bacterium]